MASGDRAQLLRREASTRGNLLSCEDERHEISEAGLARIHRPFCLSPMQEMFGRLLGWCLNYIRTCIELAVASFMFTKNH